MKILLVILSIFSSQAFAMSLVCDPTNKTVPQKVIINLIDGGRMVPYSQSQAEFILIDTFKKSESLKIILRTQGILEIGDVDFKFISADQKVTLTTFSDELNSGKLRIENKPLLKLNCILH